MVCFFLFELPERLLLFTKRSISARIKFNVFYFTRDFCFVLHNYTRNKNLFYLSLPQRINILDIISDQVTFADALSDVEPENDLHCDERIDGGLLHSNIFPGSSSESAEQSTDSITNGWNIGGSWRCQLDLGILHESVEFWGALTDEVWKCEKYGMENY